MDVKKLHFFDNSGYELNFSFNETMECWEGNVYLPKVSVGLYSNTSIYILEEYIVNGEKKFRFPTSNKPKSRILFSWDILNKFVDEFFMFKFDSSYIQEDTSSLIYTENDGPELQKDDILLVTRFDTYEIPLANYTKNKALPLHIAFTSPEKYDANTFKRTLIMEYNFKKIARISFYAETIEEDERLKILNENLGYKLTKEDEFIFRQSDIKEPKPDFKLLNEKRKELLINGHNIYPYIGSYKALINALKFFGYYNLNIIDIWINVNEGSDNYGKYYYVKKYTLKEDELIYLNKHNIKLPSIDYRKSTNIALSYSINHPTKIDGKYQFDLFELPYFTEDWDYTIEEALIKLFALRDKLNRDFLPGRSKIVDIVGEASYFGLCGVNTHSQIGCTQQYINEVNIDFTAFPSRDVRITSNKLFNEYVFNDNIKNWNTKENTNLSSIIGNIDVNNLNELNFKNKILNPSNYISSEDELCNYYKDFYTELNINHTIDDDIIDDLYDYYKEKKYYEDNIGKFLSAKIILTNDSLPEKTFLNDNYTFGNIHNSVTFDNIDYSEYTKIEWTVNFSDNQDDEDLLKADILKTYENRHFSSTKGGDFKKYNSVYFELPYVGYYDVTLSITDRYNNRSSKTFKKHIKVEPYNIDIRGFYFDARDIPNDLINNEFYKKILEEDSDSDDYLTEYYENANDYDYRSTEEEDFYYGMKLFIEEKLKYMMDMATVESGSRTGDNSMIVYGKQYDSIKCEVHTDNSNNIIRIDILYDGKKENIYGNHEAIGDKIENKDYIKYFIKNTKRYRIYIGYIKSSKKYKYIELYSTNRKKSEGTSSINPSEDDENLYTNIINTEPTNIGPYHISNIYEEWFLGDNINGDISLLKRNINYTRYIKNGVDIKPYTWVLLGFDYTLIKGKYNPIWTLTNTTTNKIYSNTDYLFDDISEDNYYELTYEEREKYKKTLPTHKGKYFTYLLKDEGNYKITLEMDDINGNHYKTERDLFIVSNGSNYKLYTPFLNDYKAYVDENKLKELKIYNDEI